MSRQDRRPAPFWVEEPLVDEGEIFTELAAKKGSSLLLGRFAMSEVLAVLDKRTFLKEARKRFLWPLAFDLDSSAYPLQRLRIFLREPDPEKVIVDLKVRETDFAPKPFPGLEEPVPPQKALAFEWLTLQNPLLKFDSKTTPLPGQAHPGLGLRSKVMDLFRYFGRLTRKDCLLAFPAYFHNAVLFSRYFRFWNPAKEGEVLAIRRAFRHRPFKQLAWIVHLNCLRRSDGRTYEWTAEEQVMPLTRPLKQALDSRAYREAVKAAMREEGWRVDEDEFRRKAAEVPALCGGGGDLL